MLKRLIEVALPLKEVSEQSAREKSIRHGHISTLHIWWARRPLAACRAAVFASLIPDPDDPECPVSFRKLVMEQLSRSEFKPKNGDGSTVEDTPRNRCLEFIKHLVKWENSNNPEYIEPARKLISAAHKILLPETDGDAPTVLDPFAGGGAIPLEALRLGCETYAVDLNPVAHLIELCMLVYFQKYCRPNVRLAPEYIKRLELHRRTKRKSKGTATFFDITEVPSTSTNDELLLTIDISEEEYLKNPLAADVKYWGNWTLEVARREVERFYPLEADGSLPVAYLWARTVKCLNPKCGATIPLIRQYWLCKKTNRKVAIRLLINRTKKTCSFGIAEGKEIDFDAQKGTMQQGKAACPFCDTSIDGRYLRTESKAKRMGQQMMVVVTSQAGRQGRGYRPATPADEDNFKQASMALEQAKSKWGTGIVPNEEMTPDRPSPNSRGLSGVVRYGMDTFGSLFNDRQALALITFCRCIQKINPSIEGMDADYANAVHLILSLNLNRLADLANTLCSFEPVAQCPRHLFSRQALAMVWDYAEGVPISTFSCSWDQCLKRTLQSFVVLPDSDVYAVVRQGSSTALPLNDSTTSAVITDPPYYDCGSLCRSKRLLLCVDEAVHWFIFPKPLSHAVDAQEPRDHRLLRIWKSGGFKSLLNGMKRKCSEPSPRCVVSLTKAWHRLRNVRTQDDDGVGVDYRRLYSDLG